MGRRVSWQPTHLKTCVGHLSGDAKAGLTHIMQAHGEQIAAKGFSSGEEFVNYVAHSFTEVYARPHDPNGLDLVVNRSPRGRMIVSLEYDPEGNYYDVTTAHPVPADLYKNKKPLWERTGPSAPPAEAGPLTPGAKAASPAAEDALNPRRLPRARRPEMLNQA